MQLHICENTGGFRHRWPYLIVRLSVWDLYEAFVLLLIFHCKWGSVQKASSRGGLGRRAWQRQ